MNKGPQTREQIVKAMVEGLMARDACVVPVAYASTMRDKVLSQNVLKAQCVLCEETKTGGGAIEHGPYCPVTLARRLRDHDYPETEC